MKNDERHNIEAIVHTIGTIESDENLHKMVLDALPALVARVDRDVRFHYTNQRYEEWFGVRSDQLVGRHVREVIGTQAFDRNRAHIEAALEGKRVHFEDTRVHSDGSERWLSFDYVPATDKAGDVIGFYALGADITDHKRIEHLLRELATDASSNTGEQ